jgi:hypothetical protein
MTIDHECYLLDDDYEDETGGHCPICGTWIEVDNE